MVLIVLCVDADTGSRTILLTMLLVGCMDEVVIGSDVTSVSVSCVDCSTKEDEGKEEETEKEGTIV